MRIVVVGAGVIGLLTAVECVRAGALVDLIDQGDIPSALATSYDSHRVVRALHRDDAPLTRAAARLHADWLEIERRLGARFYHRTGVVTAMAVPDVEANLALLDAAGASSRTLSAHELSAQELSAQELSAQELSAQELSARCPQVRFPAGTGAILEPAAGTVLADRALLALARWLRAQPGVRMYPRHRVVAVEAAGAVQLAGGTVLAGDHVVVATGPWSRDLLPAAMGGDLTLKRQTMLSYAPASAPDTWAGSPAVLGLGSAHDAWLMPPVAGRPARLSAASACRTVPEMTDRVTPDAWRDHLLERFGALLADFDPAAVTGATEGYYLTDTSGQGPMLVGLGDGAVTAYAACGGMSFKFAPVVARALADHAVGRPARLTGLDPIDRPRRFAAASPVPGTGEAGG